MSNRCFVAIYFLFLVASCTNTDRISRSKGSRAVLLDTIEITVSRENPYRGSAPKDFSLIHTKLEVKFDYSRQYLFGKAILTLKPHFDPKNSLVLDAKQFDIHEVSLITGQDVRAGLKFTYDSVQLKIQLDKEYTREEQLKIYIDYTAKPEERKIGGSAYITEDKGLYFINPLGTDSNKPVQVWTQGETESNSCWFPTIDKPNQKTTNEIYITHLKKYVSLSNGTLVSSISVNDSLVTDYWKMDLPHSPYLIMMTIGDYAIIQDRWRDVPVRYYVEKEYAPYAKQIFGNTPEMMEFFSQKLGFDYPWQKYSQVVVRDYVSGAMENTTATLHGEFIQRTSRELLDDNNQDIISHELFHQWFGDLVTCESWSNVPLNEALATYGEYLWNEYKYGREHADFKFYENYNKYLNEAKSKNVDLIRFYYDNKEDMFDNHSYEKGGLVLHYLRKTVGDDAFFKSLELYLKTNQFKSVEIDNLRLAFEEITGKDLNWFFNEWFLSSGHPVLDINYNYDNDSVFITITQKQSTGKEFIYQLPFRMGIWYGKNVETHEVRLKKKTQVFSFKANGKPDLIDFDAERVVLCEKKENKTTADYIFQYKNSPLFLQRLEALKNLNGLQEENPIAKATLAESLRDKFFYLRHFAVNELNLSKDKTDSVYSVIENIVRNDEISAVRKAAIEKLSQSSFATEYLSLFEVSLSDSSYEVVAAGLQAINEMDSKKAIELAKQFENEKNTSITTAVAEIFSEEGGADLQSYFDNKLLTGADDNKYLLFYYYANFLTRMDGSTVLHGIEKIEEGAFATDAHFLLGAAKESLKRISKWFEEKRKKAQSDKASETSQTAKLELEEKIRDCELIISSANDALERVNSKIKKDKK